MSELRLTLGEELPVIFEGRRAVYVLMRASDCRIEQPSNMVVLNVEPLVVDDKDESLPHYVNINTLRVHKGDLLVIMEDLKREPTR